MTAQMTELIEGGLLVGEDPRPSEGDRPADLNEAAADLVLSTNGLSR